LRTEASASEKNELVCVVGRTVCVCACAQKEQGRKKEEEKARERKRARDSAHMREGETENA